MRPLPRISGYGPAIMLVYPCLGWFLAPAAQVAVTKTGSRPKRLESRLVGFGGGTIWVAIQF